MSKRYSIFPIEHADLWERYQHSKEQHWDVSEVDLSDDKWEHLTDNEKKVMKTILAFFLVSDGIVIDNLVYKVIPEIEEEEAQFFYNFQIFNESIHAEMYGLFIEAYIQDPLEKNFLYKPIENLTTVRKKADWALDWIDSETSNLAHKLISFAVVEGLFFSSLFATVFYFRQGGKLPGLCQGNELIMRDENSHYEFAIHYYLNHCDVKLSDTELMSIILSAYEVEKTFVTELLEQGLPGLTKEQMLQFVQFTTDTILEDLGLDKYFNVNQPLDFMKKIALKTRSNFFERKSGEYTKLQQSDSLFDDDF